MMNKMYKWGTLGVATAIGIAVAWHVPFGFFTL